MSNVSEALEALSNLKNTFIIFIHCMNEDRLIKHKTMIYSNTYTEDKFYVDGIDPPEDDMKCNIYEKEFPRFAIS